MPEAARVGDTVKIDKDAHGCPKCPHTCTGAWITGSPDIFINGLAAVRAAPDIGVHAVCCGPNMFMTDACSGTVLMNGSGGVRNKDATIHCGGSGECKKGSPDVNVGD